MATAIEARDQLSNDLGDYFKSTTTSNAADAGEIIDARLSEEDDKDFVTERTYVFIAGGQAGGPASDEERRTPHPDGLSGSTMSVRRDFSVTVPSGTEYYINRLFSAEQKDRAVTDALPLSLPHIWKETSLDVTIVLDQFDYDISSASFYRGEPHQVWRQAESDTEHVWPIFDWDIIEGNLHFYSRYPTDTIFRVIGMTAPALSDVSEDNDLYLLSARAAMLLYERGLASSPNELRTFYESQLAYWTGEFNTRVAKFARQFPYGKTVRSQGHKIGYTDRDWRIA